MICPSTWPNYNGGDKEGISVLLKHVGLSGDVEYGKSKIFIRTPQSITLLEEKRSQRIPEIVLLLQRVSGITLIYRHVIFTCNTTITMLAYICMLTFLNFNCCTKIMPFYTTLRYRVFSMMIVVIITTVVTITTMVMVVMTMVVVMM